MRNNHNRWGGKNNRWGNRNRKGGSSRGNSHYETSKLFNTIAGGVVAVILVVGGFNTIGGLMDKPKVSKPNTTATHQTTNSSNKSNKSSKAKTKVDNDLDIDTDFIEEVLDYLGSTEDTGNNVIFVDVENADTDKEYKKNVLKKAEKYKDTVTFVIVRDKTTGSEEATKEMDDVRTLISSNGSGEDNEFRGIQYGGRSSTSESSGGMTYFLTAKFYV